MAVFVGKVLRTDLEGSAWTLVTDQGMVYQLKGGGPDLLQEGVRAEVRGREAVDQLGIAMVGDVLEVKSYRILG